MKNLVCTLKIMACLWFLPTAQLQAQTDEIKSLLEQVASSRGKDKVERLNDLSKKFSGIDPEKGIVFGRQALWLADSLKLTSEKCRIYNNLGINYLMISNLDSAMSFFHKGLNLATLYHDSLQLGMALIGTGVIFEKNGDFDSALIAFHKALNIYRLTGNSERTGRTLENIGTIHIHRGELKTSLSFLLEAITSFEKAGSTKNLPSLYIKIGRIYSETAEYATAEKWYKKGKQLSLDNGNYQDAGIAINAIGIMYKNQGKDEEALNTYLEVVPIADKIRNKFLLNAVYGNIGNVYQSLGKYDMAIDFHQKALDIAMSLNNPVERAIQYVNLGNDYNSLKNYRNAMEYLEKALPVFAGTKTQSHLLNTYEAMITASNGLRNYNQSVGYYEKYVQLKDSLNTNGLNSALDSLKVKFHTEQTEQENEALMLQTSLHQKTIRLQQVAILSSLIAVVLLLSLILLVLRSRRNMKRINSRLQELSAFKDSLTHFLVHDLKNALNTIVNFDPGSDTEYQISIVKHSGKRMLNLVHNLLDIGKFENDHMELVPVVKSLWQIADNAGQHLSFQAVSRQITIQQHRDADYIVKADEGITERILINLLENAIKHSPDDGVVEVLAESAMNMVRITIKDHGEGIPAGFMPTVFEKYTTSKNKLEPGQRSYGLGLAFCKLAVEAQGGEIGIQSEPGHGTSVWFTLPLVKVTSDMTIPPASAEPLLQDDMLIHLDAEEIAVLKQPGVELRELSIHQISDIKDILKQLDTTLYPGISQWKQAVERALYDCDSNRYTKLIQLIRPSDV